MKKMIMFLVAIVIFGLTCFWTYYNFFYIKDQDATNVSKVVETINEYGYKLESRDTKLFKEEFNNLKLTLESSEIDEEEYAKTLSKLFVIDFWTLTNKVNKYDIGGLEFIASSKKDNFEIKAKDTVYKYIEDNSDGKRKQQLPEVKKVIVTNLEATTYKLGEEEKEAKKVTIEWTYTKENDYDNKGIIYLVQEGKKLVIVEFKSSK